MIFQSLNLLFQIGSNKVDNYVTDIRWNPTVPGMLCTVTSDCTISNFQLKEEEQIREKPVPKMSIQSKVSNELQVLCAAWSPKGKQVAVGCKNGDIIQLKPDLKIARTIAGPSPSIGEVISLLWISNYQFCAAYLNNERHINVLIVDAPKGEANTIFTCYEDITYGFPDAEGEESISRYYFEHVSEWGLIIAGSSTSSEIAVLGTADGGANWNQWQLVDSGRAQLPLMRTTEIFPVGLAVDRSSTSRLPWGTDSTLPHPVPVLHILGTSGKLCSFHMVNLIPNCPIINFAPTEIVQPALPAPSQPPVALPTEVSFNMNAAATSTPRPKQPEVVPERKPAPISNIFGDSLKAAGFFQQPVEQPSDRTFQQPIQQQSKPQEEKPIVAAPIVAVTPKETPMSEPVVTETKLVIPNKAVNSSQIVEQRASIDDSIRMRAYLQEQALFERELRNRLEVWKAPECGTDEEKKRLGEASALIEQFLRDLKDTTNSLSTDIAYLKALLLQSIAWVEETKSKNAASSDITSRNCSENSKVADLQRWYYYTHTQLNQVSKILDLEWSEHKAQEMTKMKIPRSEFVYQNLLMHNKIIAKEKEKFEQISRKWKSLNRSSVYTISDVASLNRSMSNLHVNTSKSSHAAIRGKTDVIDVRCKTIATKTLSFTHEKQVKLRALLAESSPRVIKAANPSPIQDRLKATLSSLASHSSVEVKAKPEPSIVSKQSTVNNKQTVERNKSQNNPLASLNSIVARIGTPDTNDAIAQNKTQQKPFSAATSFPATVSAKQIEKKPILTTPSAVSQPKPKQELNVNFPSSITFGTSTPKSQDILFPKSPTDTTARNSKESTTNDTVVPKAPESALFSTGLLKDVLSAEYSLTKTEGAGVRNLPSLSATPITKTDAAATFSFATPNAAPSVAKGSPAATALDTMMSFTYVKPAHTPPTVIGPSVTTVQVTPMQAPIDLSVLSLGSSNPLTFHPTDHHHYPNSGADGKANGIATTTSIVPPAATTQTSATSAVAPFVTTVGSVTISLEHPGNTVNVVRKPEETPASSSIIIEKVTTPEAKAPSGFGTVAAATVAPSVLTLLPTTPMFGGQTMVKSTVANAEAPLPATTVFGAAVAFPSIPSSTFGTATSAPTASSVFSGFSNTSSSTVSTASSSAPLFSQSSLSKPTFGEVAPNMPATSFGITPSNTSAGTISFGMGPSTTAAGASIAPVFSKSPVASPVSNAQFPGAQAPASSANNVFGKSIISPTSTPFGNTSSSVFSNMPATSTNTSVFGGNSSNSIFGSASSLSSTSGNMFGGSSTGFSAAPSGSIFDSGAPKPGSMFGGATNAAPASPFGGATSNTSPTAVGASSVGANVFKSSVTNTSPMGMGAQQPVLGNQPIFGQTPAFGAKPVFGSPPSMFVASKPFGSGFGSLPTFESPGIGKIS